MTPKERYAELRPLFNAFNLRELQTVLTIKHVLDSKNFSLDSIQEYLKLSITFREAPKQALKPLLNACPNCEHTVFKVYEVNTKKCNQVGGDYTQQLICAKCEHEEFK